MQSDLMSAPSPPLGLQSDWCVPSLPLSQGRDSLWGCMARLGYFHTARLVVLGMWCISWGGSARCTRLGGAGSARFSFGYPLQEGPVAPGRSQTCQRDGSAEAQCWVFAWCKQVPWQELVPFVILAGGWAREMALASAFVPRQTALSSWGSATLPPSLSPSLSSSLPAFRAELLTYDLPDAKSACCRNTLSLAPPLLQARLGGSVWQARRPSLPPVRGACTASPPFLPSSVGLSSALGSRDSVLLILWRFSGLFRQV